MNESPAELKTIAPDVQWDEKRDTVYVRARSLASSNADFIQRFRQTLETEPDNVGVRFLLATYLQMSGQHQEARTELEQIVQAGDAVWSPKAQQTLVMTTA